ncbi:MAG: MarR family transcriptional regulator [Cyanobacteria bacterium REEB67]|nr:MarR family transcriptional regulator [Cyanobacteria bacterium REEB67]
MDEKSDQITAEPAAALASNLRTVICKVKRRLREQTDQGALSWSQISVLNRLDRDGAATVSTLAAAEGVRSQSMGATVAALEEAGFIKGVPDPFDKRQTILSLTPACEEWVRAGRAAREDWLYREIKAKFDEEEQAKLIEAVTLLRRLVES